MSSTKTITVSSDDAYRLEINKYSAQGYSTIRDAGSSITLSRNKPFNWILAIICLFIPIIGWIALIMMILAASRGSQVVEIVRA